ncbi:alanine--tRNA ligase [Patescibacteria group bacterium]|nr:alanine--tRNA ligase [Patescibacteria group bacterium]MBU4453180.1 alanine--tRNA ligase [Patescibacteria group bacterium]
MNIHLIRRKYLDFFISKGHAELPSSALIPENDPTTLFTGSGMQPMVPYLLGQEHPLGKRLCDSQKCFRAQDIEEVGDRSHTTFFEMLGNWSLGDYFKQEQIPWMFEFLTKELGLDPKRLYVTVYKGNPGLGVEQDKESIQLWKDQFSSIGIDLDVVADPIKDGVKNNDRIFIYDEKKNWWSRSGVPEKMPVGEPGGPDSEMFYDFGIELGLHEASGLKTPCHPNCDCGRFVEIGNNVFMQYQKTSQGFEELPQKNVDFGGGLERIAAALNNDPDMFKINVFAGAINKLEELSGKQYGDPDNVLAFRVALDHIRAATFLIADRVVPSNKDHGYFVRRLLRRAIRYGKKLGINSGFTDQIAGEFIDEYKIAYPRLAQERAKIIEELVAEEEKFRKTLEKGEKRFSKIFDKKGEIEGEDAFELYATYGFPLELTEEMAKEQGQKINREVFECEFDKHKDLSRAGSEKKFKGGLAKDSQETTRLHTATHILHQALRNVLGNHVEQRGSNITSDRLRFDFSHPEKLSDNQKQEVERIVNEQIQNQLPITCDLMSVEDAKSLGAIGLFGDKYKDLEKVKVYTVGNEHVGVFSREICGGPHANNTVELGHFRILKEEASSAGIRRIKAILE